MATDGQAAAVQDAADAERQSEIDQAVAEGHDADIPSRIGYILDEKAEVRRRDSIASRTRSTKGRRPASRTRRHDDDLEKEAGLGERDPSKSSDEDDDEEQGAAALSEDDEANVVWWDGPDDQANPYNWPAWRKIVNCAIISTITFITPLASCKWP